MPRIPGEGLKLAKSLGDQPVLTIKYIYIFVDKFLSAFQPIPMRGPLIYFRQYYISLLFVGKMFPFFFSFFQNAFQMDPCQEEGVRWLSMKLQIKFICGEERRRIQNFLRFDGRFWKIEFVCLLRKFRIEMWNIEMEMLGYLGFYFRIKIIPFDASNSYISSNPNRSFSW